MFGFSVDNGQGIQGHGQDSQGEGSQPNRVTPVPDLPGRGEKTHSSMEVDEDDVEKANPPSFDRVEDLAQLRY